MLQIKNPVLPGFNADPSIIRVDDTYTLRTPRLSGFREFVCTSQKI